MDGQRKAAVVVEVLKNQVTGVEACHRYGIKQSELEEWMGRSLEGRENPRRANPRNEKAEFEMKIMELQAKVGELVLERDVLR